MTYTRHHLVRWAILDQWNGRAQSMGYSNPKSKQYLNAQTEFLSGAVTGLLMASRHGLMNEANHDREDWLPPDWYFSIMRGQAIQFQGAKAPVNAESAHAFIVPAAFMAYQRQEGLPISWNTVDDLITSLNLWTEA